MKPLSLFSIYVALLLSSCSSLKISGRGASPAAPRIAHLVSERPLDDYAIHSDIMTELQKRGYQVVDHKDVIPNSPTSGIVVRYLDKWKWDFVMYMQMLKITVLDGSNSNLRGSAKYETYGFHTYPDPTKTVLKLFSGMDKNKVL